MIARHRTKSLAVLLAVLGLALAAGVALAVATANPVSVEINEDAVSAPITLTGTTDTGASSVTYTVTNGEPGHGVLDNATGSMACTAGACSVDVHYTPDADYNGGDSFTYVVTDSDGDSPLATVSITIDAVNDAPSFSAGSDPTVLEDSGGYSASWATAISAGPADESGQAVTFSVTGDDNASLFSTAPAVSSTGTLTFTPAANANGVAHMTVTAHDDGGTANGGVDTSAGASLTIMVTAVNDPPSFSNAGAVTVLEDAPLYGAAWATNISPGPPDESAQTVTFTVSGDDNAGLFAILPAVAADGTLSFRPLANANGTAHLTVTAKDNGGTANGGVNTSAGATLTINVTPVNDRPTFTDAGSPTVLEDSGAYSGASWATAISPGPADESSQIVSFSVSSDSNPGLFSTAPAVSATGTLSFTPAADANGSATVGIVAVDNGGTANGGIATSILHTITIAVTGVNDAPTFTPGASTVVNQDTGAYSAPGWATAISAGPANESSQTLTFHFTADDNAALFSTAPAVSSSGTLTFTPAAGHTGTAHLSLTLQDDGGTANGGADTSAPASVTIRVNANPNAVNDTTFVVPENSAGQVLDVLANDTSLPDPPETLTVTAVTQGVHGTATKAVNGGSVTYKPVAGYYGSDFFTYTISDPFGATDTATVFLTISKDTTPPTVSLPAQGIRTGVTMGFTSLLGALYWTGSDSGVGLSRFDVQRSVNGGAFATVTLSSPTATSVGVTFILGDSYQFRVRGVDKNGNVSAWATTPKFVQARFQESSGYVHYAGTWTFVRNVNDYGGAESYTGVAGRSVTFTHVVRDVAFVAPRGTTRGSASIYIDGVFAKAISLHKSTSLYRQVLWSAHFSKIATHSIKIVVWGNGRVDLDCFVILD